VHFVLIGCVPAGNRRARRHALRDLADCAPDLAAAPDGLGAENSNVAGHFGGGAPRRDAQGPTGLAGRDDENVDELEAALAGGERLRARFERLPREDARRIEDSEDDPSPRRIATTRSRPGPGAGEATTSPRPARCGFDFEQIRVPARSGTLH
jgi:hypothetical protein